MIWPTTADLLHDFGAQSGISGKEEQGGHGKYLRMGLQGEPAPEFTVKLRWADGMHCLKTGPSCFICCVFEAGKGFAEA